MPEVRPDAELKHAPSHTEYIMAKHFAKGFFTCYHPSKEQSVLYPLVGLPARPVAHRADSETLSVLI